MGEGIGSRTDGVAGRAAARKTEHGLVSIRIRCSIHSFTHSLTHPPSSHSDTFLDHLLGIRHCSRCHGEQNRQDLYVVVVV